MKIYIFEEPEYRKSDWCQKITNSIIEETKSLRVQYIFASEDDQPESCQEDFAIVISSNLTYAASTIEYLRKQFGYHIILITSQTWQDVDFNVNTVAPNALNTMHIVLGYLYMCGKTKTALYGINDKSMNDLYKVNNYIRLGGDPDSIYYTQNGLRVCFDNIRPNIDKYDAIICVNDIAAYSLLLNLQSGSGTYRPGEPYIVSCVSSVLCETSKPSITAIEFDWQKYGYAVRKLINTFLKVPECFSSVNINIPMTLKPGGTTLLREFDNSYYSLSDCFVNRYSDDRIQADGDNSSYYSDKEVREILCYKKLLATCDEIDFKLLEYIKSETPIQVVCKEMFFTEGGYKYRIQRIKSKCDIKSKQELHDIVVKYLK